jgi:hypothetical protein
MKMEQTQCSETTAIEHHTPGDNPKDYTQHEKSLHTGFWIPLNPEENLSFQGVWMQRFEHLTFKRRSANSFI